MNPNRIDKSYGFGGVTISRVFATSPAQRDRFLDWAKLFGAETIVVNRRFPTLFVITTYHKKEN